MAAEQGEGVKRMKLGSEGLGVSAQGLGCMGMSAFYGPPKPDADMITLIHHAVDSGVTFLDTSDIYGTPTNEILLAKMMICGNRNGMWQHLKLLTSICRQVFPVASIVMTVGSGSILLLKLELGIGIIAYSPLGRGFLSSGPKLVENFSNDDYRKYLPRFQAENLEHNKKLYEKIVEIAEKKGCSPSQLALAWVHHQGNDVFPIPGTTKIENLNQNIGALSVKLTPKDMAELEKIDWVR